MINRSKHVDRPPETRGHVGGDETGSWAGANCSPATFVLLSCSLFRALSFAFLLSRCSPRFSRPGSKQLLGRRESPLSFRPDLRSVVCRTPYGFAERESRWPEEGEISLTIEESLASVERRSGSAAAGILKTWCIVSRYDRRIYIFQILSNRRRTECDDTKRVLNTNH